MLKAFIHILFILLILVAPVAHAQTPLRIAYPSFPPFHWKMKNGRVTGFFYDIITEAVENRMGLPVVWTAYPWPRCQANLRSGRADAILTVPTVKRAAYSTTHWIPFFVKKLHVFTRADHKRLQEIRRIRELPDIKRGDYAVITYCGNGWHMENIGALGIKTHETPVLTSVWKMLAAGRGDIVIEWPYGAWPDIRRLGLSNRIVQTPVVLSAMSFHMLIGRQSSHVDILMEFDAVIQAMRADGTMDRIMAKYR